MDYPYEVYSPSGQALMHAPESCRYPVRLELEMIDAGYTLKLNGKRITKTELRKLIDQKGTKK